MIQSYQVVILVHSLRNTYLSRKGVYTVQMELETESLEQQPPIPSKSCPPYMLFKSKSNSSRQFVTGNVSLTHKAFVSERLEMRYVDQQVSMCDVVGFKIDLYQGCESALLTCTLEKEYPELEDKQTNQKYIRKVQINTLRQGICQYIQVPFEANHQVSLNMCLFSIMTDCKQAVDNKDFGQNWKKVDCNQDQKFKKTLKEIRYFSYNAKQNLMRISANQVTSTKSQIDSLNRLREEQDLNYFYCDQIDTFSKSQYLELYYEVCTSNYVFMKKFLQILESGNFNIDRLKLAHSASRREKYTDFVFKRDTQEGHIQSNSAYRRKFSKKVRKASNHEAESKRLLPLQIIGEFAGILNQPIAFHQVQVLKPPKVQQPEPNQSSEQEKKTLYVMCHGFQGEARNLILLRNNIKKIYPSYNFLLAKSFEDNSGCSIAKMGSNLASQILECMHDLSLTVQTTQISFIGFSMGGVIARASLKHLANANLGKFVSIASPHLGSEGSPRVIRDIGLWALKFLGKYQCINQLCFNDNNTLQDSLLYKLSSQGSLIGFEEVVLVSSGKDPFVPWESCRIQPLGQSKIKRVQKYMIQSMINNQGKLEVIHRFDFDISQTHKSRSGVVGKIQDKLGRNTHMEFLKSDIMIRMLLNTIPL